MAERSGRDSLAKKHEGLWRELPALIALLLLSLPAAWPLLQPGWPDTHDQHYHLFRLIEFDQSFRQGILYPRWAPDLGLGHGAPLFNFVPPLAYYLAEAFHLLGADFVASINLSFFAAFILSPLALYLWARKALGSRVAAVVAALAYNYAPYHFIDTYQRGALPEAISFVFYPLALWAIHGLVEGKRSALPLGALALAGAVLAHNVTALPFLPIALLYLGGLLFLDRRGRSWAAAKERAMACLLRAGLMLVLGLALSALYWLPALWEMPATTATTFLGEGGSLGNPLVEPTQVIQGNLAYDYGSMPYKVGLVQAVVVLIGLGATFIGGPALARRSRQALATSSLLLLLLVGLTSSLATPLWNASGPLVYIQFAWRLLLFVALFGALLTGAIAFASERRVLGFPLGPVVAALALAFLAYASLAQENRTMVPIATEDLSPEVVLRWAFSWRTEGSIAEHQFTPRWVQNQPSRWDGQGPSPTPEALPPIGKVEIEEWRPQARRLVVEASQDAPLRLQTFYFPGWQAYVDGEAVPTFPSTEVGLITLDLPPGRHLVEVRYEDTLPRHLGLAASGLGLLFLLALLPRRRLAARLAWAGLGVALSVGALAGGASLLAKSVAEEAPTPLEVGGSPELRLLGYRSRTLPEKGTPVLTLDLFWLVGKNLPGPLRPTLELLDAQGKVVVNQEAEPVYGTNPPRVWQPNEVVRDRYQLFLPPGLPAGQYQLNFVIDSSPRRVVELGQLSLPSLPPFEPLARALTLPPYRGPLYLSAYAVAGGAEASPIPGLLATASPGQPLKVSLFWKAQARLPQSTSFFVHLLDTNFNMVAQRDEVAWDVLVLPMGWLPGETVSDEHILWLPQDLAPGLYQVTAGVYDYRTREPLPLTDQESYRRLGWTKVRPPQSISYRPQYQANRLFEEGIALLGYDIGPPRPKAGEPLALILYWRAEANVADDLTVFAHLVDAQGRLVAQHDSPPGEGSFPTWIWEKGDVIADTHPIQLPQDLAPGDYRLVVGLYHPLTVNRLPAAEGNDSIVLGQVNLSP